ncbi:MAG: hypothetical protein J7545_01055 [Roseofilum sp. SBFL]|uniref:hypothetical protein n=1 Tax=unclassified Roseofilum TaxID=2620099 RepID=UPI001B0A8E24|nr:MULTISPECIES: hypothetical protein [unclassified Roseofilum]MBP0014851.1 hypothetical protein [Roseofilum sp. SID3]MBP0040556.1 hypothetical protein [Roseofilum sp. SBFL]
MTSQELGEQLLTLSLAEKAPIVQQLTQRLSRKGITKKTWYLWSRSLYRWNSNYSLAILTLKSTRFYSITP